MTAPLMLTVNQQDFSNVVIESPNDASQTSLAQGQVLFKVNEFSFTANNITYAAMGDVLQYWKFFPAQTHGYGVIPVWGFGDVLASKCEGVNVGERFYGYYPMATHVVVEPSGVNAGSFIDGAAHRKSLSMIYNQYIRCSHDPMYSAETEALQMLLRPLFTTSFLLDDFIADNDFFGAHNVILTSASSKTALGMAFALNAHRSERDGDYQVVGLTSAANREFVEALGCYDQVLTYDDVDQLDSSDASVIVDFAGNGELLGRMHRQLGGGLKYSCLVGASHWDQRGGLPEDLIGPAPVLFFAPSQAEKRINEWGGAVFGQKLAAVWQPFIDFVANWIVVEPASGVESVERVYREVLSGHFDPKLGYILSMWPRELK